jgi:hypothetical protein
MEADRAEAKQKATNDGINAVHVFHPMMRSGVFTTPLIAAAMIKWVSQL